MMPLLIKKEPHGTVALVKNPNDGWIIVKATVKPPIVSQKHYKTLGKAIQYFDKEAA